MRAAAKQEADHPRVCEEALLLPVGQQRPVRRVAHDALERLCNPRLPQEGAVGLLTLGKERVAFTTVHGAS